MYKTCDVLSILEKYAPLSLSRACVESGDYDNSGIIIDSGKEIKKILFSLDLSDRAVEIAVKNGADLIVTHHPAIYLPIKGVSVKDETTSPVYGAIKGDMSVISMHLNLDIATFGIDYHLAKGLGAKAQKILTPTLGEDGYGREFKIERQSLSKFIKYVKETFKTERVIFYGDKDVETVASFCGGGSSHALTMIKENKVSADTVVTSDMPHHVIKELTEGGKNIVLLPHYTAEEYGFRRFYEAIEKELKGKIECSYFADERFI